jgi:MinD-like ATPase involved in chromosome partitioning or flagellar assembly
MADRYVVLGLARVRAAWFGEVARWSTSAALPVEFVKVVSVEEARARLRSGRQFSALLVDGGFPGLDRDLVDVAATHACAVVAVDDGRAVRGWSDLGVAAVLHATFERDHLLDALCAVARPIARSDRAAAFGAPPPAARSWRGRLVAVTGAGGVGRSTIAMALAAGLAADPRDRGLVLLADLALRGQQALLHDADDVVPGLLELIEAHRTAALSADDVRALCYSVPERGYELLLGLRRHREWTALHRRAVSAALDGIRRAFRVVVADTDADVEGEADTGSVDVEERNLLARSALADADLVLVVGHPGLAGAHAHLAVVGDLLDLGVEPSRILPVVNRAPRNPRQRADLSAALAQLLAAMRPGAVLACSPVFVPERRGLDQVLRDGVGLPLPVVRPVSDATRALIDRLPAPLGPADPAGSEPVPVVPGSLATWTDDQVST